MKQAGVAMIEVLLVIIIAAAIITLGLNQYRNYRQNTQYELIQGDITTIKQALNQYYNTLACNAVGKLPQSALVPDVIYNLDMNKNIRERFPYISGYHARIIDSGVLTKDKKPVYQLQVRAHVASGFVSMIDFLRKRLEATKESNNSLYWIGLPNNSITKYKSITWVMNVSRDQFRNLKNDPELAGQQGAHSYCAR